MAVVIDVYAEARQIATNHPDFVAKIDLETHPTFNQAAELAVCVKQGMVSNRLAEHAYEQWQRLVDAHHQDSSYTVEELRLLLISRILAGPAQEQAPQVA